MDLLRFVYLALVLSSCLAVKSKQQTDNHPKKPSSKNKSLRGGGGSSKGSKGSRGSGGTCSKKSCSSCCGGMPGVPGSPGQQGIQGIQGVQGVQGTSGVPGNQGPQGPPGEKGNRGFKGERGDTNYQTTPWPSIKPSPQIAFSVSLDIDLPESDEYRVIQFNIILTNIGGAYDPDTSIFTSPLNGTYMIGFSGVSYHGQNILIHLVKNGQRVLSAFDNSGCTCCEKAGSEKCAGSGSNAGVLSLEEGDKLWLIMPDQHGMHNALYHNYASFYGYLIFAHY